MKKIENAELIYGRNPVYEALMANRVISVYLSNSFSDKEFIQELREKNVQITVKSQKELSQMVDGVHQGIIAYVKRYEYYSLEDILRDAKKKKYPIIVILDEINDPHNLGAIMRSCDIFDVSGIIVKKHGQALLNSTVAKTSAGAINYVKVCQVPNLSNTLDVLKKEGFWIVSADGSAKTNYRDLKYDFPTALIIGNEGKGISRLLLEKSDYVVKIPMHGKINSLNASNAAAILLSNIDKEN